MYLLCNISNQVKFFFVSLLKDNQITLSKGNKYTDFYFKICYITKILFCFQEEGHVCMGQILAYGALIESGLLVKIGTVNDQQAVVSQLLELSKKRSYLPHLVDSFLDKFIASVSLIFSTLSLVLKSFPILFKHKYAIVIC